VRIGRQAAPKQKDDTAVFMAVLVCGLLVCEMVQLQLHDVFFRGAFIFRFSI
jgi:hypothetical protein